MTEISNRADRSAVRRVDFPCRCPGDPPPHPGDSAQIATLLGYGDRGTIRQASRLGGIEAGFQMLILLGVRSWTLTLPDGKERPITAEEVALLDEGTVDFLVGELGDALDEKPIPKASGGRSPSGRRAKRSSIPTIPAQPRSMTA